MNPQQPVSFPGWKSALALSNLPPVVKSSHTREIITFLHHCKKSHSPATVGLIKQWLETREKAADGPAHVALRWFYRTAPKEAHTHYPPATAMTKTSRDSDSAWLRRDEKPAPTGNASAHPASGESVLRSSRATDVSPPGVGPSKESAMQSPAAWKQRPPWRPMEPRPASQDLGGPDWEQVLVATLRVRGLLSRTEDTYRAWAKRFAAFIAPKSPYAASGEEVSAFLTHLAVNNRASPSNQRQALNALVFLMEKSLGRELGAMDFRVYGFADAVA